MRSDHPLLRLLLSLHHKSHQGKETAATRLIKNRCGHWASICRSFLKHLEILNKAKGFAKTGPMLENGLLFPRRYVEQVASPDILPPDFKNPYLYVPTHLCSQSFCIQLQKGKHH